MENSDETFGKSFGYNLRKRLRTFEEDEPKNVHKFQKLTEEEKEESSDSDDCDESDDGDEEYDEDEEELDSSKCSLSELHKIRRYINDETPTLTKILNSDIEFHDKCKLYEMYKIYQDTPYSPEKLIERDTINCMIKEHINDRKLHEREENLKKLIGYTTTLRSRILDSDMEESQKEIVFSKYLKFERCSSDEKEKLREWIEYSLKLPQTIKPVFEDALKNGTISEMLYKARNLLDKNLYGMDQVKTEILMILNHMIINPDSSGHSLALCGPPGVGKTELVRTLSSADRSSF